MILDTSFLIDLMKGKEKAVKKEKKLQLRSSPQLITIPTLFELWSGIVQSGKPEKEKEKILEVLSSRASLDFDRKSAKVAGKIDGELATQGKKIEPVDSMIAGIAITNGEKILTSNTKHFERIAQAGFEVEYEGTGK